MSRWTWRKLKRSKSSMNLTSLRKILTIKIKVNPLFNRSKMSSALNDLILTFQICNLCITNQIWMQQIKLWTRIMTNHPFKTFHKYFQYRKSKLMNLNMTPLYNSKSICFMKSKSNRMSLFWVTKLLNQFKTRFKTVIQIWTILESLPFMIKNKRSQSFVKYMNKQMKKMMIYQMTSTLWEILQSQNIRIMIKHIRIKMSCKLMFSNKVKHNPHTINKKIK